MKNKCSLSPQANRMDSQIGVTDAKLYGVIGSIMPRSIMWLWNIQYDLELQNNLVEQLPFDWVVKYMFRFPK